MISLISFVKISRLLDLTRSILPKSSQHPNSDLSLGCHLNFQVSKPHPKDHPIPWKKRQPGKTSPLNRRLLGLNIFTNAMVTVPSTWIPSTVSHPSDSSYRKKSANRNISLNRWMSHRCAYNACVLSACLMGNRSIFPDHGRFAGKTIGHDKGGSYDVKLRCGTKEGEGCHGTGPVSRGVTGFFQSRYTSRV